MNAAPGRPLFTIGHSNYPIGDFLALLRGHGVEAIVDVRSRPYSRFVPHFSKERLASILEEAGLAYLHLGRELGGKPQRGESQASAVTYRGRVQQLEFRRGIDRLLAVVQTHRIALMCRERDPLDCHRLHLICRYLRPIGLDVRHILPDGKVEVQQATERRLLRQAGKVELPLFQDAAAESEQALTRAYDGWWERAR